MVPTGGLPPRPLLCWFSLSVPACTPFRFFSWLCHRRPQNRADGPSGVVLLHRLGTAAARGSTTLFEVDACSNAGPSPLTPRLPTFYSGVLCWTPLPGRPPFPCGMDNGLRASEGDPTDGPRPVPHPLSTNNTERLQGRKEAMALPVHRTASREPVNIVMVPSMVGTAGCGTSGSDLM